MNWLLWSLAVASGLLGLGCSFLLPAIRRRQALAPAVPKVRQSLRPLLSGGMHHLSHSRLLPISAALAVVGAVVAGGLSIVSPVGDSPDSATPPDASASSVAAPPTRSTSPEPSPTIEATEAAPPSTIPAGELSLSDFAQVKGEWEEGFYNIGGSAVQGLGTMLQECDTAELGLTVPRSSGEFTASVGHDLDQSSWEADALTTLKIYGNTKLIQKTVIGLQPKRISVPIRHYRNVTLRFTYETPACRYTGTPAFLVLAQPTLIKG
jgi:hypothetical protein